MARNYAKILPRIWADQDFRTLTTAEQHLYLHLLSHPKLSYAGVCDWRPRRLAALAADGNLDTIELAGAVLQAKGYIVVDDDTEEVFVRSYHRNDEALKLPNMGAAVAAAFAEVTSTKLLGTIVWELQRLHAEHRDWKGWASIAGILEQPATDPAVYRTEPLPLLDEPAVAVPTEAPF